MGIQKTKAKNEQTNNNNEEFKNSTRDSARFPFTSSHAVRPRILLKSLYFYTNKKSATRIRLIEKRFRKCQDLCGFVLSSKIFATMQRGVTTSSLHKAYRRGCHPLRLVAFAV